MTHSFRGFPEEGLRFLGALRKHNDREWFQKRKDVYLEHVKAPMEQLILDLSEDFADFGPEFLASPKVSAYRIYRDTRFSADKSPYKTHTAAVFPHRDLGKHAGAGFYVHVSPRDVFVGGGLYRPERVGLQAIREEIAAHPDELRRLLARSEFRRLFGELRGERLSRPPRGFPREHPAADLLRHKQFLASRSFPPETVTSPRFHREIVRTFKALLPLLRFLNGPLLASRRPDPIGI